MKRRIEWCLLFGHKFEDQSGWTANEKWYGQNGKMYHGDNPQCCLCGTHRQGGSTRAWYLAWRWRQVKSLLHRAKQRILRPLMQWLWKKCGRGPHEVIAWHDPNNFWHRVYRFMWENAWY